MTEWRMPRPGEGWRNYSDTYPSLFEIVDIAANTETGEPMVIFKPYRSTLAQSSPLYAQPLCAFLSLVPVARYRTSSQTIVEHVPRFKFEREAPEPELAAKDAATELTGVQPDEQPER